MRPSLHGPCLLTCLLLSAGLLSPSISYSETHTIALDEIQHEPVAFGTYLFGFGQKNEDAGIWPCNMWSNFDPVNFAHDIDILKLEGGNSAIILFPFFDVSDRRAETGSRLAQLKQLLDLCETKGMALTLRLGYEWDSGFSSATKQSQVALVVDPAQRKLWYDFCDQTYALASRYHCFHGAFICWEDYWGLLSGASLSEAERKKWAAYIHYPKATVPARDEPSMEEYFDYFDEILANDFFVGTKAHFPGLGMEVRLDEDPIFKNSRPIKSFVHRKMFAAPGLTDVYLYWGPYLGARNEGDLISADTAVNLLRHALGKAQDLSAANARFILSQFNYRDNTPGFSRNSRIVPEQLSEFIQKSSKILNQICTGVYTWSNTSYYHNAINNGTFSGGAAFWTFDHALAGLDHDQPCVCVYPAGAILQHIDSNSAALASLTGSEPAKMEFSAKASDDTAAEISLGDQVQKLTLKGDTLWHRYVLSFEKPKVTDQALRISVVGGALIDDVVLANHKQEMGSSDKKFARDITYADLAWALSRGQAVPSRPSVLFGVAEDNWIISRASFAVPSEAGRYHVTIDLTVPEIIRNQTLSACLRAPGSVAKELTLNPGQNRIVITGTTGEASVILTLALSRHQRLSADGPDVRELAAHLDSVGP